MSLVLTVLWVAAGAARAPLESPRRPQLGGGHDAALGPLHDDLAALSRFAPQLSRGRRIAAHARCRAKAAWRAATWATRSACCSSTSPNLVTVREEDRPDRRLQRARSSSTAATTASAESPTDGTPYWSGAAPRRRHRALRPLPAEGAMRFVDEVDHRGHRRRRRQRLGVVPAREVRAARRARRRRRRPRRQHLRRRRSQHQHADRIPLRAHPSREARRERPRRRQVRPRRRRHRPARARRHGDHRRRHRRIHRRSRRARRSARSSRKGGKGGLGNIHFKSSTNRAPRQFTPRRRRREAAAASRAQGAGRRRPARHAQRRQEHVHPRGLGGAPKVADYPFTTLAPNLGVVRIDEARSFVVADIPGLIEGAAEGAGLGHQFLRHLQRTRMLLHIVDIAPFDPEADPVRDARAIVAELARYDAALLHEAALARAEQARPRSGGRAQEARARRSSRRIGGRARCSPSPR